MRARKSLATASRVVVAQDQVSCEVGGEVVILQLDTGTYYGLDPVGSRIWALLQQPRTLGEIRDALVAEYAVAPARLERDVLRLLVRLERAGLIEVRDAPAA
jgi:hypothetical protein